MELGAYSGINNLDTKGRDLRILSTAAPNAFTLQQSTGNVGIGNTSPGALLDIGNATHTLGTMRLEGDTSGYVQIQPSTAAGDWTMTLPSGVPGSNGYVLSSTTAGVTSWVAPGSLSGITLGTSASATNPQRSGQVGTGLFSATSNTVSIADNGADVMDIGTAGPNIIGTIATGNYSIGYQINGNNAIWQDVANFNLAVGLTAFPTTVNPDGSGTDGQYNTAVGYHALSANTTGTQNTALGSAALVTNTTGIQNTAVGFAALSANTTGSYNTAVGLNTLVNNTTGTENTAVGQTALNANTTGSYNTAVGMQALFANVTGINNTTLGFRSGFAVVSGTDNTLVGY